MPRTVKNYVQLDDKFFIVELNEKGQPSLREAKEEEVLNWEFEKIALRDSDDQVDESLFQDIINKAQIDMEAQLTKSMKNLILNGLGVSAQQDGTFYIGGFNDKNSAIVNHVVQKMQNRFKEFDLNRELDLTDHEKKKLRDAMKKKFKETYESEVSSLVWREAKDLARKHVASEVEAIMGDKMKAVAKGMVERALNKKHYWGD